MEGQQYVGVQSPANAASSVLVYGEKWRVGYGSIR